MIITNFNITTKKGRKLVSNLNLNVNQGDKIALIGEEGDGKSTFIKALVDKNLISSYADISGQVSIEKPIGYLSQFLDAEWNYSPVQDYFLKDNPNDDIDYQRYESFGQVVEHFVEFGLNPTLLDSEQIIGTLSGGEKVKLQLIKIALKAPEIYIFDEPTNDIDLQTLDILEKFIKSRDVPVIFVSHDETFIENTANAILHFEQIKKKNEFRYTFYKGDLKSYNQERKNMILRQNQIAKMEETTYNEKMSTIQKLMDAGAGDKVVRRLMAQRDRLEKKGLPDYVDIESAMGLFFNEVDLPNGKVVCDLKLASLNVGEKTLLTDVDFSVCGNEKVVIIGANGVGKSTLIKEILKNVQNKTGIKVGYMPQNYRDSMNFDDLPIDFLCPNGLKEQRTYCFMLMGVCKFTTEEMTHKIGEMSGGQQAKLYILKMVIDNCNVLILDEPTRNLSPMSNPVVRNILKEFNGAIISVSHDRKFIKEVCDKVYEIKNKKLKVIACLDF